jgi:hypothetical protein
LEKTAQALSDLKLKFGGDGIENTADHMLKGAPEAEKKTSLDGVEDPVKETSQVLSDFKAESGSDGIAKTVEPTVERADMVLGESKVEKGEVENEEAVKGETEKAQSEGGSRLDGMEKRLEQLSQEVSTLKLELSGDGIERKAENEKE